MDKERTSRSPIDAPVEMDSGSRAIQVDVISSRIPESELRKRMMAPSASTFLAKTLEIGVPPRFVAFKRASRTTKKTGGKAH